MGARRPLPVFAAWTAHTDAAPVSFLQAARGFSPARRGFVTRVAGVVHERRPHLLSPPAVAFAHGSGFMVKVVHTSELMNPCPRQALLRIEGKEHRIAQTALVTGLVGHAALQGVTEEPELTTCTAVELAWDETARKLLDEGRSMAAAVVAGEEDIKSEVQAIVDRYRATVSPMVTRLIGCELPVSLEVPVGDGEPITFESHIDKLYIGADPLTGEEAVVLVDWKFYGDGPSSPFIARSLQLGMYQYAVKHDGVMVGDWPFIMPDRPLRCYWAHMNYFRPYKRKQKVTEPDGEQVEYQAGDSRPMHRCMLNATVTDWDKLLAAFAERVEMMRAGIWPAMPEPKRCMLCQSNYACDAWGAYA